MLVRAKFAYNVPEFGEIDIEGDEGNLGDWTTEDIISQIEKMYPEAIDIEVLEVNALDG